MKKKPPGAGQILHLLGALLAGLLGAWLTFMFLPITEKFSSALKPDTSVLPGPVAQLPPPPPPPEPEEEKKEEKEEEPPKLEEPEPQPLSLDQLELALNPGTGGIMGDFTVDVSLNNAVNKGANENMDEVFSMGDLDNRPKPIFQSAPQYPGELRKEKKKGQVYLIFIVDRDGKVKNPQVKKSSHPAFEKAALDAVKQWKFEPATRDGKKVMAKMAVPITFDPETT
jgi:periplasmic protein TonB